MAEGFQPKRARRAAKALLQHVKKEKSKRSTSQLFEDAEPISLFVGLKRVPEQKSVRINPYEIELPHPLYNQEGIEACLIVKDKEGESPEEARRKLSKEGVTGIPLVVGVDTLRNDYRVYEARRKLAASYDLFLADSRVIPCLPKLLGNPFMKRKKQPIPVELGSKSTWKPELDRARRCTHFYIRSGTCSVVKCGTSDMDAKALTKNIKAIVKTLKRYVPGGWQNVQSLHIKTDKSVALPIYSCTPDELLKDEAGDEE